MGYVVKIGVLQCTSRLCILSRWVPAHQTHFNFSPSYYIILCHLKNKFSLNQSKEKMRPHKWQICNRHGTYNFEHTSEIDFLKKVIIQNYTLRSKSLQRLMGSSHGSLLVCRLHQIIISNSQIFCSYFNVIFREEVNNLWLASIQISYKNVSFLEENNKVSWGKNLCMWETIMQFVWKDDTCKQFIVYQFFIEETCFVYRLP